MTFMIEAAKSRACIAFLFFFLLVLTGALFTEGKAQESAPTQVAADAAGQRPTGDEIMRKVRENEYSETVCSTTRQTLVDRNGKSQERLFKLERKGENVLIRFLDPPDLKNVGYLVIKNDKDPDKDIVFVYFPPPTDDYRQINVDDKESNESFLGSDFDVTDFQIRDPEETTNTYIKTESVSGNECHVLESVPRDTEYKYSRMTLWISTKYWLPIRVQFFDRENKMVKEMKVFKISPMGGRQVISKFQMVTLETDHRTVMDIQEIEFDVDLPDDTFTIRRLTKP